MKMTDTNIGETVFRFEKLEESNEIRETYYTRNSDKTYLHHGCIQGNPLLEEEGETPRYINLNLDGFEYKLINFPVKPMSESIFKPFLFKSPTE